MERVTVFTANIGRKGTAETARNNIAKIKQYTQNLDNVLIGWQEIDEADPGQEHEVLQKLWPHNDFAAFKTAVPILTTRPVELLNAITTKTCDGRPKVTPARFCIQAKLQIGESKLIHLNGHYPFNAPDLRRDCNREWTRLAHQWYELGYTVITTRDTNWHGRMPKLHPKERLLTTPGAIDRITVIENKLTVRVAKRHRVNLTIDGHDAIGLTLTLKD